MIKLLIRLLLFPNWAETEFHDFFYRRSKRYLKGRKFHISDTEVSELKKSYWSIVATMPQFAGYVWVALLVEIALNVALPESMTSANLILAISVDVLCISWVLQSLFLRWTIPNIYEHANALKKAPSEFFFDDLKRTLIPILIFTAASICIAVWVYRFHLDWRLSFIQSRK